ncbi:glycosyltransferase family 4 protein [Streptomyces sp. NPDC048604]|uniref:glycosyltransferase family 4 protein n=1 Tax=Streptomyces sp. NPDC048604 TaxID=3365578 RepID=UPI003713600C
MNTEGVLLVTVSGPARSGTSSLVRRLAALLRSRGFGVGTARGHVCFLCHRFNGPPRVREREEEWAHRRYGPVRSRSRRRRAHALVHAAELSARTGAARLLVRVRAHGRPAVVVTDGGPLDALASFDPNPGSTVAALYSSLSRNRDLTLLLEVSAATLAARGWARNWPSPHALRERYKAWAHRLPDVAPLDGEAPPAVLARDALDFVLDTERSREVSARRRAEAGARPRRIVVSTFDDAGNPDYRGGGALVVDKMARRLAEDFRLTVVTAGRRGGTRIRDGIRYVYLPVCWAGPRFGQVLFQALLPLAARRIPHDVWIESFSPPFSTSFLPLFSRAQVVGVDQGRSGEVLWHKYHIPFFLIERIGLRCYRNIVVMNEADASTVRRINPRADVQVIANGVEQQEVDDSRLGEGEYILYLGRIDIYEKGLDLLLAAYRRGRPALPLLIAGSGTEAEERKLKALLDRMGGDVRWLGHADEERKHVLLRDSAFLVMPSRHETFGLVALEGMSYGKPVLHFALPSLHWMRDGGEVGVPPFDVDALADGLRMLAADAQWRRRLGRKARQAAQRYTWEEMTGRYVSLTHNLLGSGNGPDTEGREPGDPDTDGPDTGGPDRGEPDSHGPGPTNSERPGHGRPAGEGRPSWPPTD